MDNNLILYLPFDDPDGDVAYDYSQSRSDAVLSDGAEFSKTSKKGKSLSLNGGDCTTDQAISFSGDFTLCFHIAPSTDKLGWLLNLPGVESYLEQWIDVTPDEWIYMAFVKSGSSFAVYKDLSLIYSETLSDTPTGLSINDQVLSESNALIDEVMLYDVAKTASELRTLLQDTDVEYYIDGHNFKDFGVYVSASSGLISRLKRKEALTVDWDNYHGTVRDKRNPRYEGRTITLTCFIEASSRSAFIEGVNLFLSQFDAAGNHRLKVEYDGSTKPLVYEVEALDEIDIDKVWAQYNDDCMVGTFKIVLTEDEPVKKVLRHISSSSSSQAQITVTSTKHLNIYWGDGSYTYNVSGTDKTVYHTYTESGEFDIVVTGVIEDIESFSTNAIVVWNILK